MAEIEQKKAKERNLPDEMRCTAKSKTTGERCRQPRHEGFKVCYWHGGPGAKKSLKHGLRSKSNFPTLEDAIAKHREDQKELKSVDREIAVARSLQDTMLSKIRKRIESQIEDPADLKAFIEEKTQEIERLVRIAGAMQKGEKIPKADMDFFLKRRTIEEVTEQEEQSLLSNIRVAGDLVAKKAKMEDGLQVHITMPQLEEFLVLVKRVVHLGVKAELSEKDAKRVEDRLSRDFKRMAMVGRN